MQQLSPTRTNALRIARNIIIRTAILLAPLSSPVNAQFIGRQTGCYADQIKNHPIQNNPNRPTVANPADVTQYGVLELEYGWDHGWPTSGQRFTDAGGLLKFGLLCDVELRWTTTSFLSQTDSLGTQSGFGDNWFGPQLRLYKQTRRIPSIAVSYAVKVPSASAARGLGSGRVDHQVTLLFSKDVLGVHFDLNASEFFLGRAAATGFDHTSQFNVAFGHALYKNLQIQGEFYGNTRQNNTTPGFVSGLSALVWNITPRLEIDAGLDSGMTYAAPRLRIFAGFTYAIANLYRH
jgi:Putative MetA-pathway of phenol degradation